MAESNLTRPPNIYRSEIDLGDLLRDFWERKWLIGGVTAATAVIALVAVFMLPDVYRAEALLTPNDQRGAGNLSAIAGQYGGLASLAGLNLSAGRTDKTVMGIGILRSRKFISEFIARHDILVPLMAAKRWNRVTGELQIDVDLYDAESKTWVRKVRPPAQSIPSSQEAYEAFMDLLSVAQDNKTGFVTISVEHYSPIVAKQWVDWLVEDLNAVILRQDVTEAEQAIEYLQDQINSTPLAGLRDVFFRLIEEQTKTVMLAKVSEEYVFKTIDPAILPERKARPKRLLIVLLSGIIGILAGLTFVGVTSRQRRL